MSIEGKVSRFVQAVVRIKSRFGSDWHDWWENGDLKVDAEGRPVPVDTSGESLGLNHAEYMKLRGYWIRIRAPIPTVRWIHVGSSDLGMFNPWTIGKVRYIDRDNAKGVFVLGRISKFLDYHVAAIALPKLWTGPYWSTGVGDPALETPYWTNDWAYGLKLRTRPFLGNNTLEFIATTTVDLEQDIYDPDAIGSQNPTGEKDFAVDLELRYGNTNATLEWQSDPLDFLSINALGAFSYSKINPLYSANAVANNAGFSPVVYDDVASYAVKVLAEFNDPFKRGFSPKVEYFNIGEDYNTIFGSRREADVLLTDGFIEGGQLPTLNLANEFVDFDEKWYESVIGWHGATLLLEQIIGRDLFSVEYTFLTYNTNKQNRDVETVYPDFLHTDGYSDTDLFDYANVFDRGRDLRAVYRENQARTSHIAVVKGNINLAFGRGISIEPKVKYIRDLDRRDIPDGPGDTAYYEATHPGLTDNYVGDIWIGRVKLAYPFTDEFKFEVGAQIDRWYEENRSGSPESGYNDYTTRKNKVFSALNYNFGGATFRYYVEVIDKDLIRKFGEGDARQEDNLYWNVIRSKATLEVSW